MRTAPFSSRIRLVILTALIITFLMGLSRVSLMLRMEALGLYEFDLWDYFIRVVILLTVCLTFLYANVFYNQIKLGPIEFNLLKFRGIVLFNLLIFIPMQIVFFFITIQQVELPVSEQVPLDGRRGFMFWAIMTNLALMMVSALVGTVYRFIRENYRIQIKNEMLQKESAEARFANLKEQLNPHFLFNSFSTLNGLIDESPAKAKKFVYDMSDVYRYVLKNERVDKVTLREEMEFANIYLSMVKERFGESIQVSIDISKESLEMKLPPLAIQMLVENAVKHNSFDRDHPLQLTIHSLDNLVVVKNSLKVRLVTNNHSLGLHNLNQRYKYLSNQEISILKTPETFEVQIPLLK